MKTVVLEPIGRELDVATSSSLVVALLREGKGRVRQVCGGKGICATCHVKVIAGSESLTPIAERERKTLSVISGAEACSRLACQAHVVGEGVAVQIPPGIYLEKLADIEALIGRRAEEPLYHPISGQILVPSGKIITRSVVTALRAFEVDIAQTLSQTQRAS
jgi:ferredoxin